MRGGIAQTAAIWAPAAERGIAMEIGATPGSKEEVFEARPPTA